MSHFQPLVQSGSSLHSMQADLSVLQVGVRPEQSLFSTQATQAPEESQTFPDSELQSGFPEHARQVFNSTIQIGVVPVQVSLVVH